MDNLLDIDALRRKLQSLLGDMPITQIAQGKADVSGQGLLGAMRAMPQPFSQESAAQGMDAALGFMGAISPGKYPVFHGTRATRKWYDDQELMKAFTNGQNIPEGIASSTFPIEGLRGKLGGLKMMDGLGPHAGTPDAANARIAQDAGLTPSKAFNTFKPQLDEAYILPLEANISKPFLPKNGEPWTETQLQRKLSEIAQSLGFSKDSTRGYSSVYPNPKLRGAQKAVKDHLLSGGYDAIPYINSHEARGSTSWVFLDPDILSPLLR